MKNETVKPKERPPNYTPQEISDECERAMCKVKYPYMYGRLKRIEDNLKIVENEYNNETIPPMLPQKENTNTPHAQNMPGNGALLRA